MSRYVILLLLTAGLGMMPAMAQDSLQAEQPARSFSVPKLSGQAYISLLTIEPGEVIYQIFGHTAIRVVDTSYNWDLVYNYGAFDFAEPNFALKFIRGKLMYFLWVEDYRRVVGQYAGDNRWIREQKLRLDSAQRQQLFELLTVNAREEYKFYQYDFLFNNCSTKPRDILLHAFGKDRVVLPRDADDNSTLRELIDRYVFNEWVDFGIDLLLGAKVDRPAGSDRTFLPEELMGMFDQARIGDEKLVTGNEQILDTIPQHHSRFWITPGMVFWLIFFIVLYLQLKRRSLRNWKVFPFIYFSLLGLIGWLLVFMWFFTDHAATKYNFNILWAMPLNLPLAFYIFREPVPHWFRLYLKTYRVILILLLVLWWANPQQFHSATVPLILTGIILVSRFLPIPTKASFTERWFG